MSLMETADDLRLVKESILLPVVMDVLEVDIKKLSSASLKMPIVYVEILKSLQNMVIADMYQNRLKLRKHGIKVYEQRRTKDCLEATYLCRGYHHKISLMWGLVKSDIQVILYKYIGINSTGENVMTTT
ncbi:hypothetical protein GCM10023310_69260 [Paenibacillus vulneris]|uniref:Uncharacterized protein n=1 Tax=Paenibacillus vulneris TaxID=1133364 RepID=A0ABW3UGC7_9BACL